MRAILKPITTVILVLFILHTQAQLPQHSAPSPSKAIMKGKIIDSGSKKLMEYANIAVYNTTDSTLVTGGITDNNGHFEVGPIIQGTYYLDANFIGFERTRINNIKISNGKSEIDLGTIALSPSTKEIGTVEVVANQARVEYKIDKKVINVAQDVNAAGGTAVDVLENTPSIQVDMEGNVSLRGSSSFTVYIDGRPSVLSGSDALQQIPSSAIQNIEIITNPSAKYDPDGNAGIINLVMKKNVLSGFNGIVNAMGGTGDKRKIDLTLNQKTKKRNLSFGFNSLHQAHNGDYDTYRETYGADTTTFLSQTGDRKFIRTGFQLKGGIDFYLTPMTTLGFGIEGGQHNFDMKTDGNNFHYTDPASINKYTLNKENSTHDNDYISGNINFSHLYNEEGTHKLEGSFQYRYKKGDDESHNSEIITDNNFTPTNIYDLYNRSSSGETTNRYRMQIDYTQPVGTTGKLEAGVQARLSHDSEDYSFEDFDSETQTWINNDNFSSDMEFKRNIYSGYLTYSSQLAALKYMLGFRGELTDRKIEQTTSDEDYKINRFDWFPSIHLSYDLLGNNQIMTSYSRRINRPRGWDINPFASYEDQYTIRQGNPGIKPEFTNSFEFGYMKTMGKSFLSLEAFYRSTNDLITRISELGEDNIIYQSTENVNKDHSLGGELMANINIAKWLMINANVSLYNYKLEGQIANRDIGRESTNFDGNFNSTFNFSTTSKMQFTANYRGSSVSAQGSRDPMFFSNISYKQEFMNRKLSATLSVRDVFGTAKFKGTSEGESFHSAYEFKREPRVVMLTLSFKLNNYKMEKPSSDGSNEMDFGEGGF